MYVVFKLLEGETFRKFLERGAGWRAGVEWVAAAAEAIAAVHAKGLVAAARDELTFQIAACERRLIGLPAVARTVSGERRLVPEEGSNPHSRGDTQFETGPLATRIG